MPLQITGRHLDVNNGHKSYIEKKITRLRKHFERIDEISFVIGAEKLGHFAEINFRAGRVSAFAKASDAKIRAAIDKAVDKVEMQVIKSKNKRTDKKRQAGAAAWKQAAVEPLPPEEMAEEE